MSIVIDAFWYLPPLPKLFEAWLVTHLKLNKICSKISNIEVNHLFTLGNLEQTLLLFLSWKPSPQETEQGDHSVQEGAFEDLLLESLKDLFLQLADLLPTFLLVGGKVVELKSWGSCGSASSSSPSPSPPPTPLASPPLTPPAFPPLCPPPFPT